MKDLLPGYDFMTNFKEWKVEREPIKCQHHSIDQSLAYFVSAETKITQSPFFAFSWFGATVTEQILHRYFPNTHAGWKLMFGEFPIPMRGAGMGCIAWDNPIWLIEEFVLYTENNESGFRTYLSSWKAFTEFRLGSIGLNSKDFYSAIVNSRSFTDRSSWAAITFLKSIQVEMDGS